MSMNRIKQFFLKSPTNTKPLIYDTLRDIRTKFYLIKNRNTQAQLAKEKYFQKKSYSSLSESFENNYLKIKKHKIDQFIVPLWNSYNKILEKQFLPYPPFNFLQSSLITKNMFATGGGKWLRKDLAYLEGRFSYNELKNILTDDYVGQPLIVSSKYLASRNGVYHLLHLAEYFEGNYCNLNNIRTIVEWGGGYGDMAKLLMKMTNRKLTYIMIDTPLISCLQWIYLSTIFGKKNVHLVKSPGDKIIKNKFNILPLSFANKASKIKSDLFISTYALSESSKFSQDYVQSKHWFNSKHILMAYRKSDSVLPYSDRIGVLAKKEGAIIKRADLIPGEHYYAFK